MSVNTAVIVGEGLKHGAAKFHCMRCNVCDMRRRNVIPKWQAHSPLQPIKSSEKAAGHQEHKNKRSKCV